MAKEKPKKAAAKNVNGTMLRRLTSKTIMGSIEKPKDETHLYAIFGVASSTDVKESQFGPANRFLGDFRAVRADGAKFRGPTCYLPEPVSGMLKAALDQRKPGDDNALSPVEFAFNVSIVPADNKVGYEYRTEPLTEPAQNDTMAALEKRALEALPAP